MASGPLRDVRILDLTHVWAGPLATRILADLGAQVVKIEAPMGRGPKVYRGNPIAGFIGGEPGDEPWNINAAFVKLQRNKKSVCIDLKTENGRQVFLGLVSVADVVIENFSARAMHGLGLDYINLEKANPLIIHVAMPGYGLSGPYRDRVAFGPTVEPMSGLTSAMGYGEHEPRATAMALPDPTSAVNATAAVVTALRQRERTGKGLQVEMSLHESAVSYSGPWLLDSQLCNRVTRIGNRHPACAPHGMYPCAGQDNWIAIACRNQADWDALCQLLPGELEATWNLEDRRAEHDRIDETLEKWTRARSPQMALKQLQSAKIPSGIVYDTAGMLNDPQSKARGFFVPLEHGVPIPGNPLKMTGSDSADWSPCPPLGSDNASILTEWLDYDAESITKLYEDKVIFNEPPL